MTALVPGSASGPSSTLDDPRTLAGRWRLDRTIVDTIAGESSRVEGVLELTADGGGLRWTESGRWHRPGAVLEVGRVLLLTREADGWWVRFEDGRAFHPWTPYAEVVHPCGRDNYRGTITGDPTAWTVRWKVVGPAKDYTMTTRLTRG